MFIWYFMDDVTYVRDVEVFMYSMIWYVQGCICCGSENFELDSLHDEYFGLGSLHDAELRVLLEKAKAGVREYRATVVSDSS